jgi:hypothetical protein
MIVHIPLEKYRSPAFYPLSFVLCPPTPLEEKLRIDKRPYDLN